MVAAIKALAPDDAATAGALKESIKIQNSSAARLSRGQGGFRANLDREDAATVVIGIDSSERETVWRARKRGQRKGKNQARPQRGANLGEVKDVGVAGYAVIQEFGSEKMQANPFMRPGFEATAEQVIRGVAVSLKAEIEKSASRLARRTAKAR